MTVAWMTPSAILLPYDGQQCWRLPPSLACVCAREQESKRAGDKLDRPKNCAGSRDEKIMKLATDIASPHQETIAPRATHRELLLAMRVLGPIYGRSATRCQQGSF